MMRTYVVAELGINHNGDLSRALEMVRAAANAGVDAVKLQVGDPTQYVRRQAHAVLRDTPWGRIPYVEYRKRLELTDREIRAVVHDAKGRGLDVGASPLDRAAVHRVAPLVDWLKVASPKATEEPLLREMRATGLPVVLSTGMSTWEEVDRAVETLDPWAVLHCVSRYPCPDEDLALPLIPQMIERYPGRVIGYSGHEVGLATTVAAVALGARVVERHFTLSRALWGSDQAASVEYEGFRRLVRDIRNVERALERTEKVVQEGERANMQKFRLEGAA